MATDIYVNDNGDFEQDEYGNATTVENMDEIAQSCKIALNTRKGGWYLDTDEGLDWDAAVGSIKQEQFVTAEIRDCLLEDPRIDDVHNVEFKQVDRNLNVAITIEVNNQLKEFDWETGGLSD